jgi:AbiV family abortive infection protein
MSDSEGHPVYVNAIRLLEDAQVLRKSRRYASCAALVVLSLEELGKFLVQEELFRDSISPRHRRKIRHSHKEKQRLAAEALIWKMGMDDVSDLIATQNYSMKLCPIGEARKEIGVVDIIALIDETYTAGNANMVKHRFLIELARGNFDKVKQECLYADRDEDGVWVKPDKRIDRAMADEMLRLARKAINSTKEELLQIARIKKIKPDDAAS